MLSLLTQLALLLIALDGVSAQCPFANVAAVTGATGGITQNVTGLEASMVNANLDKLTFKQPSSCTEAQYTTIANVFVAEFNKFFLPSLASRLAFQ